MLVCEFRERVSIWSVVTMSSSLFLSRGCPGYIPDTEDKRDRPVNRLLGQEKEELLAGAVNIPESLSRTSLVVTGFDQFNTSACVTFTGQQVIQMRHSYLYPNEPKFFANLLEPYYNVRPDKKIDRGMSPRKYFQRVRKRGVCLEADWPFDPKNVLTPPPLTCYVNAFDRIGQLEYYRCDDWGGDHRIVQMKNALYAGYPLAGAFPVDHSFTYYKGGVWSYTGDSRSAIWHYATIVGYTPEYFIIHSSGGSDWGIEDEQGRRGFAYVSTDMVRSPYLFADVYAVTFVPRV